MNTINVFKTKSLFETRSNNGTLAYPNTSAVKETQSIHIQQTYIPEPATIEMFMTSVADEIGGAYSSFEYESNMTWKQYFNSKYATDFKTHTYTPNCEAAGIEPKIWYEIADDGDLILCIITDVYCNTYHCGNTLSDYSSDGWDYIKLKLHGITLQTKISDTLDGGGFIIRSYFVPCRGTEPNEDDFKYRFYDVSDAEFFEIIQASRHLST